VRCFEFHAQQCHLSDGALAVLGRGISDLPVLARAVILVPMNSLTVLGLRRFMDVLTSTSLTELTLDVSGNWIRGADYGYEVVRPATTLPALRHLSLTFGGWGVRKRFGLEHLSRLGLARGLRSLSVRIVGARVTSDALRKAIGGLANLPLLTKLDLDLATCEVGDQCHRALVALRSAIPVRRLTLCLGAPGERVLQVVAALRHMPSLERLHLTLDWRLHAFSTAHAQLVAHVATVPEVGLCLCRARWAAGEDPLGILVSAGVALQLQDCMALPS
jgi:hypothetical protein